MIHLLFYSNFLKYRRFLSDLTVFPVFLYLLSGLNYSLKLLGNVRIYVRILLSILM